MDDIEKLKSKIEEARKSLNESVTDSTAGNDVYKKSVELDILIERYINVYNPAAKYFN